MKGKNIYIILIALCLFSACGSKGRIIRKPFPVPKNTESIDVDMQHVITPIYIYWSSTISERGFAQDKNGMYDNVPEFNIFLNTFKKTLNFFRPKYYTLQKDTSAWLKWKEAFAFAPDKESFYTAILGGSFENRIGPLTMLYQENRIDSSQLTVVVSDLQEQGLNNTKLTARIRENLLRDINCGAAVIAFKLPFWGTNWKPNPERMGEEMQDIVSGDRLPLYLIVTGPKNHLNNFLKNFIKNGEGRGIEYHILSTIGAGDYKTLYATDIDVPMSASIRDVKDIDKNNKRVLNDIWNIRVNDKPDRIWNLRDQTDSMVDYFIQDDGEYIDKPLNLKLLQYRKIGGGSKNGHKLWQLNFGFDMPTEVDASRLEVKIENYTYLVSEKQERFWKDGEAQLLRDIEARVSEISINGVRKGNVSVYPHDIRKGLVESSVICFNLKVLVKQDNILPDWVHDFNDSSGGKAKDKTQDFIAFVNLFLGIASPDVILDIPVVLFDMPGKNNFKE
ncbi:MAG: hypothetical protein LBR10_06535 [Prevotellaceae bacterium]|jgi:hypothetical protein|nr:hypothetical protein [Prevotellaceae bacterium]